MTRYGSLTGLGVGPGDPDLLTLKAVKILGSVDRVFAARSSKNSYSTAMDIVRPHLKDPELVTPLDFPMTREPGQLEEAWKTNAGLVLDFLATGRDAAFLTLGDPMTYSTFGYLSRTLWSMAPDLSISAVPGVTSYQAAAAESMTVLAESEESLAIVSGALGGEQVEKLSRCVDTLVVLKAYKRFSTIRQALEKSGRKNAVFASKIGQNGAQILTNLDQAPDKPGYFSLILSPGRRDE